MKILVLQWRDGYILKALKYQQVPCSLNNIDWSPKISTNKSVKPETNRLVCE